MANIPRALAALTELQEITPSRFCGVYFLCLNGKVVYVGQSVNVMTRVQGHERRKAFDQVFFLPVPKQHLDAVERGFIKKLRPKFNKVSYPGRQYFGYNQTDFPPLDPKLAAAIGATSVTT